jgi:hypothetical protein
VWVFNDAHYIAERIVHRRHPDAVPNVLDVAMRCRAL